MIGILNAHHLDSPPSDHYGEYTRLILDYVESAFKTSDIQNYNIVLGEWPKSSDECDVWIITGSSKAAYDSDPWISKLKEFIVEIDKQKRKLLGICFGHQVIAAALGGLVIKSPLGWGVGVKTFKIDEHQVWMTPALSEVSLLFSHQDQVIKMPSAAKLIAHDSFCEIQMFQIGSHILTMQGHPEYTPEYLKKRMEARRSSISPETFQKALESLNQPRDFGSIGQWMYNFSQR